MTLIYLRLVALSFAAAVIWMARDALDAGGPVAVVTISVLIFAVAMLVSSVVRK